MSKHDSDDGEIDKLLAELEKEPEESQINDTIKKIKAEDIKEKPVYGEEWDNYEDTVKMDNEEIIDDADIKDKDTFD